MAIGQFPNRVICQYHIRVRMASGRHLGSDASIAPDGAEEWIEVEIHYDSRRFRLRVRDNGKGMDPKVLAEGGRTGHYGLPGMQERAKLVGGKLAVWSEIDSGTETELTIPASLAYAKPSVARRWMSSRQ